jgi:hypothetical protein
LGIVTQLSTEMAKARLVNYIVKCFLVITYEYLTPLARGQLME